MQAEQTSFLSGANAPFIEELYARFLETRARSMPSWRTFFAALDDESAATCWPRCAAPPGRPTAPGSSTCRDAEMPRAAANRNVNAAARARPCRCAGRSDEEIRAAAYDTSRALMLIRSYRVRGHLEADLDPLGLCSQAPHQRARSRDLRLHARPTGTARSSSTASLGLGDAATPAPDHGPAAQDLLRHDRRRVHAHPRSRPEGVDPGAHRGTSRTAPTSPLDGRSA